MKNNKKGFSLAEVLIAVTIASIIATMGFTIARKGIERAYNQYIYAGYYAISVALSDAEDGLGLTIRDCADNLHNVNACAFSNRVVNVLSGRHFNELRRAGELNFDTPNGTRFHIAPIGGITPASEAQPRPLNRYLIKMDVPSVKTRNSSTKTVCMVFTENLVAGQGTPNETISNILIPYELRTDNAACSNGLPANERNNIQDRKDILAFYFEDGLRGKVLSDSEGQPPYYHPRVFRSAREAFCIKLNNAPPAAISNYLRCQPSINGETWENPSTVIKVTDPRRI